MGISSMTAPQTQTLIDIDYTTIARLLTDLGVPADRGRYLIRLLATSNNQLLRLVKIWTIEVALSSGRLSDEQFEALQSALRGNSSECHTMHQNAAENSPTES